MPTIFISVLAIELLLGTWLGVRLRRHRPASNPFIAWGLWLYMAVCVVSGVLAAQFPGPAGHYPPDSGAAQLRTFVIGPAQLVWTMGPLILAFFVAYVRAKGPLRDQLVLSPMWYLGTMLMTCMLLPIWLAGALVHGAHYAGAWL